MAPIYDDHGRWLAPGEGNHFPEVPEKKCVHGTLCKDCSPPQQKDKANGRPEIAQ